MDSNKTVKLFMTVHLLKNLKPWGTLPGVENQEVENQIQSPAGWTSCPISPGGMCCLPIAGKKHRSCHCPPHQAKI